MAGSPSCVQKHERFEDHLSPTVSARVTPVIMLPLAEARNRFSALVDEVTRTGETLTITDNGLPAAVVVSAEDYDSLMETLVLMSQE